ncbi:MAG: M17 family metallopeptidase [Calditrichaceae bacterium]
MKPSADMDEMKFDMAGAAATIGIINTASIIKPNTELIGIVPAVENMPGGNAVKPGDIIEAYNGKTVEIINTDAEGRLILADALAYSVKRFKPNLIIDFATLTGSIMAALGDKMAGMFSNSEELNRIFQKAGSISGDMVWPMPMLDAYSKLLESKYADIVNLGGRWGGAITAAKFLEEFVSEKIWVHFDIAGKANDVKNVDYLPEGATGFGPRLFFSALEEIEKVI